jgi:non-heme chloroperoxidase
MEIRHPATSVARYDEAGVAKTVFISSVPPLMVKTDTNPGGLPKSAFDDLQAQLAARIAAPLYVRASSASISPTA